MHSPEHQTIGGPDASLPLLHERSRRLRARKKTARSAATIVIALILMMAGLATAQTATPAPVDDADDTTPSPVAAPTPAPAPAPAPTPPPVPAPTDSPTVNPTKGPTKAPTNGPTKAPTKAPTNGPTSSPTAAPTVPPTKAPSRAPTLRPTTARPTTAPPTAEPSLSPTNGPTTTPSANPTRTFEPSDSPSNVPTQLPVAVTDTPTLSTVPSDLPSISPSKIPSDQPSSQPSSRGSDYPSFSPSVGPSDVPSSAPQSLSFYMNEPGYQDSKLEKLEMGLFGVSSLSDISITFLQKAIQVFSVNKINDEGLDVQIIGTEVVISDVINSRRRLQHRATRGLQGSSVSIVFDQAFNYITTDDSITPSLLSTLPFSKEGDRMTFTQILSNSGLPDFASLVAVSPVVIPATPAPSLSPTPAPTGEPTRQPVVPRVIGGEEDNSGPLELWHIIVIAVCGGLVVLICCYLGCKSKGSEGGAYTVTTKGDDPPNELKVGALGADEVSTLDVPKGGAGLPNSNESLAGYGDQSVATVDYDYSKAYGGGGDTSVSSAGGTFGSNLQGLSTLGDSAANNSAARAALGGAGSFSDTDSFEAHYRDPSLNVREELIHILAPPGKLGVVIDTPDDGAPVVHAVKDSSVISDKIRVGDKLVAVDGEDVRSMTAIKVSKLISRKSTNAQRKLTIVRTTAVDSS